MVQNNFCSTCTICDMGQPPHPSGQVTFACHLPRDKFCKKYLSDPDVTMPCCVTAYVFVKLSRNQSWVNLLLSVMRDSVLDSIPDSLFSILHSRFVQESRIANCIENRDLQRTVNLLLNSTVCKFNYI